MNIRLISPSDSRHDIQRFYDIMVHAYEVTEAEIWGENYKRMFPDEFQAVIKRNELIGAWIDDVPVGSIHAYALKEDTYAFGLFSVDFTHKGKNIGRQLISAAEEMAKSKGAKYMELEILRLKDKILDSKQQLHHWYLRLGYERITTVDFVDRKPTKAEKAKNFIAPSVFDCYRKRLE
ncbi:MAG: GNAT family N-acetyltransferase [Fluviicola sp.]